MYILRYDHSNTKHSQNFSVNQTQFYNNHHGYDYVIIELTMGRFASIETKTFITYIKCKWSIIIDENTRLLQIAKCVKGTD